MSDYIRSNFESLRIASVPFYNAWPLTRFLDEELPQAELFSMYPSAMREAFANGQIDVALLPVAEITNISGAEIIADACIGSYGAVQSVLLVSKIPLEKIRTLALDSASRTSVTLAKIMLQRFYSIEPEYVPLDFGQSLNRCRADALVVIGDRALAFDPSGHWKFRYDLGQWWYEKTGLPFVFAAWVGVPGELKKKYELAAISEGLAHSRDRGVALIDRIVDEKIRQFKSDGMEPLVGADKLIDYLKNSIQYFLDDEYRKGLALFREFIVNPR